MTAYEELTRKFKRLHALQEAQGMLGWDMSAMMPAGGAEARTEQLATLSVVCHEILTDPSLDELFDRASAETKGLDDWTRANLKEMQRRWLHATALESDLVEALSKACKRCEMIWRQARPKSDYQAVLPALKEVLNLTRQAAAAKAERLGCSLYDALLDEYEPGGQSARIDAVFEDLAGFLPDFLDDVLARQAKQPALLPLEGPFPIARQEALARRLMAAVGFDFEHGRLDVSAHPFCGAGASPAACPTTCASPPATTRTTSPSPSWACCMRPATPCTSAACRGTGACSLWARRAAWRCTRASPSWSRCRPAAAASSSAT